MQLTGLGKYDKLFLVVKKHQTFSIEQQIVLLKIALPALRKYGILFLG